MDGTPRHTRRISLCPLSSPRSQTMQLRRENGGLSIYILSPFLQMSLIRFASSCSAVRLYFTAGFCYLDSPFYLLVLYLDIEISRYTCRARTCGQNGQTGKSPHRNSSQYLSPLSQDDHHQHSFWKHPVSQDWRVRRARGRGNRRRFTRVLTFKLEKLLGHRQR